MSAHSSHSFMSAVLLCALIALVQGQSIVYPTTAAPAATIVASASGYTYAGCWNETTDVPNSGGGRALTGGKTSANNTMTTADCLAYCGSGFNGVTMQYAGLEYGRECWCGAYLSALSEKLNETARCIYACDGNGTEICGGANALTLYNLTSHSKKTGTAWSVGSDSAWYGTAALLTLCLAAFL